jgi:hypothetical protein
MYLEKLYVTIFAECYEIRIFALILMERNKITHDLKSLFQNFKEDYDIINDIKYLIEMYLNK